MQVFIKIVDKGSLVAAANALSLSPAMVSNHLQTLEKHVGAALIYRTTRRQQLTELGQQYYDRCVEILGMVADTQALASGHSEGLPTGKITISAPTSFGSETLVSALHRFHQQYPQIETRLLLNDRNVDLIEDDIDLAIRIGKLPDSNLIARELCTYKMIVCASPDYLQRCGTPTSPEQLSQHNCLLFRTGALTPWKFYPAKEASDKGITEANTVIPINSTVVSVSGNLQTNNGRALRKAACEGMGIIMQPCILLKDDIQQGLLVPLLNDYVVSTRTIHLLYLKNRNLPPKTRSLIDFLLAYFADEANLHAH